MGLGDFNFPNLRWEPGTLPPPQSDHSIDGSQANILLGLVKDHLSFQIIMEPTRNLNTLDLVIVNNEKMIKEYHQEKNVLLSDHNTIFVVTNLSVEALKDKRKKKDYYIYDCHKYNMKRNEEDLTNWSKYEEYLNNEDWDSLDPEWPKEDIS